MHNTTRNREFDNSWNFIFVLNFDSKYPFPN